MNAAATSYDERSLTHERRMIEIYRRKISSDAAMMQPLANACWRAAAFEWHLNKNERTARALLGEAAQTLAQGFSKRPTGFDSNPDQLICAINFAIVGREKDAFVSLAMNAPNLRGSLFHNAQGFRSSQSHFFLAEGYALLSRSIVERRRRHAESAAQELRAALESRERDWWERQFPSPLEAAWLRSEHETVCILLKAIAEKIADEKNEDVETADDLAAKISSTFDEALRRLDQFLTIDSNHHPKLYFWLSGLAVCTLAASAGFDMTWLTERYEKAETGYDRLPLEFLQSHSE